MISAIADNETWGGIGSAATLDDEGYKAVLATCCNLQMEVFMFRLIDGLGLELSSSQGPPGPPRAQFFIGFHMKI